MYGTVGSECVERKVIVMGERPRMDFGYHPPSGERNLEVIRPREFVSDLHNALDVATRGFGSIWIATVLSLGVPILTVVPSVRMK